MTARSATPAGTWVVVPCYGNAAGARRVANSLPAELRPRTLFIDDGSAPALDLPDVRWIRWIRHPRNRGYGGAQKTGYRTALDEGAERVVLLHGDAQYPTGPTLDLAGALVTTGAWVALGSRFLRADGAAIPGWRRWGNRTLTGMANRRFGTRISELHTGARAFSARALRALPMDRMSDDYVFDQQALAALLAAGVPFVERSVEARYDDDVQSITLPRSLRYGAGCLWQLLRPLPLQTEGGPTS